MSETTDYYSSWEGSSLFGNVAVKLIPPLPPAPPTPIVIPEAIARFDFNQYTAGESFIGNSVDGGDPATIFEPLLNTFDTTDASNNFLLIYAPDNFPLGTGGVLAPSLSNIATLEMWVQYATPFDIYSQYFVDARTGATNGFWITSSGNDTIGDFFDGAAIYFNTFPYTVDSVNGSPSLQLNLNGVGWVQVVIVPTTTFTDDVAFFSRFTGVQGMPLGVADIAIYDTALTQENVKAIYNDKCSRYGLSPVV